jgi:hopene-associated glycosyltransferase HpnB
MLLVLGAWTWLLFGHGFFWLARERDDRPGDAVALDREAASLAEGAWPSVVAVVPARDEADVVGRSVGSLLDQDYPGEFRVILVDDNSTDGTAAIARRLEDPASRLRILDGAPLAEGWTGKVWAQSQGIRGAHDAGAPPDFFLLTDADITHSPGNLRALVERACAHDLVLCSLMARLTVETFAERLLVPAFVFYFAMIFPFAFVNDPKRRVAAAAGGCMLVRRRALEAAGGLEAIAGAIIDDCALAARMKRQGPIWLGLTDRARSLRPYESLGAIGRMVRRSAFAQLGFSPWLLLATTAGMFVLYLAPPMVGLFAVGAARLAGFGAWLAMAIAYQPMLSFYRLGFWRGALMPLIGAFYLAFTVASAIDYWRGRGGMWKGRAQAIPAPT